MTTLDTMQAQARTSTLAARRAATTASIERNRANEAQACANAAESRAAELAQLAESANSRLAAYTATCELETQRARGIVDTSDPNHAMYSA